MPNIYIQNIELGVSSVRGRSKAVNPHISTVRQYSNFNSKSAVDSSVSGGMKVELNMSVKFSTLNPLVSPIEDLKYIKVMTVQCLSKEVHDRINGNPFSYFSSLIKNRSEKDYESGSIKTNIISMRQLFTSAYNRSVGIDLLGNTIVEDNEESIPYSLSTATDSTSFFSIPLKSEFIIKEEEGGTEAPFLSYFVFSFYDKEQKSLDTSTSIRRSLISDMFSLGKISSEVVINNRNINKRSYAFKDDRGIFWNGTVHQMRNGQWMKHSAHSRNSEDSHLSLVEVDNVKIRDNRIYSKLASLKFDLLGNTEYTTEDTKLIDQLRKDSNLDLIKRKANLFSDLCITRDKTNNARFMFSINMEEMVKKNTDFPKILDNVRSVGPGTYDKIIEEARINNISIKRSRIRNSERLTSQTERASIVDDQETIVIANSSDSKNTSRGLLSRVNSNSLRDPSGDSLEPKVFGLIEEIFVGTSTQNQGIRHFTGTDFDISSKKDGEYEYSLEIEVQDPIIPLLKSNLASLQRIIGGSSTQSGFEQYYRDSLEVKEYYDSLVGQFNPSFLGIYNQRYNSNVEENYSANNFLFRSISFMVRFYYQMSSELRSQNMTEISILNYLTNISSPTTGSPEGIQKVLQLMYSLESSLKRLIQKNTRYVKYRGDVNTEAVASDPSIKGTRSDRSMTMRHIFKNKFNAMTDPSIGYDFLFSTKDQAETNIDGLAYIGKSELAERFSLETSKYFVSNNTDIEIRDRNGDVYNKGDKLDNTKFSFLTVSNIFLKQEDKNVSFSNINSSLKTVDRQELNDILTQVSLINQNDGLFYGSKSLPNIDKTEQNLTENLSAFQNATVGKDRSTRKNSIESKSVSFSENAEVSKVDDGENLFSAEQRELNQRLQPEGVKRLLTSINQISKEDFLSDSNSIGFYFVNDEGGATTFKKELVSNSDRKRNTLFGQNANRAPELNKSPNQVKALMLSLLKSKSVTSNRIFDNIGDYINESEDSFRDPMNAGLVFFNYKNIRRVEVFRGFESQKNKISIANPIWTPMTKGDIDSRAKGQAMFCRHVMYTNSIYGISENNNLSLPSYNEFFFVSQDLPDNNRTTGKGEFILKTVLGDGRVRSSANDRFNSKIEQFFSRRAKTTDPILSREVEALRPEFMNSNVVVKDINLAKLGVISKDEEAEILNFIRENEKKTALNLVKDVKKTGLGKLLPSGFERNSFNFAELERDNSNNK